MSDLRYRLRECLPARYLPWDNVVYRPEEKLAKQNKKLLLLISSSLAGFAAAGWCLLGFRAGVASQFGFVVAVGILQFLPLPLFSDHVMPVGTSIQGWMPPKPIVPDLSTPEMSAHTLFEALEQDDRDLVRRCLTDTEWELFEMGISKLTHHRREQTGRFARVWKLDKITTLQPDLVRAHVRTFARDLSSEHASKMLFTLEDNEWRITMDNKR